MTVRLLLVPCLFTTIAVSACSDQLYKIDTGPYSTSIMESTTLHDAVQDREVTLRVLYPDAAGDFPLVVFSPGMFCFPQLYDRFTRHWASHGYIVIVPNHLDSPNLGKIKPEDLSRLLSSRIRDMSFILQALDDIEAIIDLQIDRHRIAVAGHSFGGMISMIKSGLYLKADAYIYSGATADDRFTAAVVMSGVGQMKQMEDNAFDGLTGPLMATGGTLDTGKVGDGVEHPWEWRMSGFTRSPPGDKYSVALKNGDHYLGGLICRDNRGGEADPEGVAIDRAMTTAFLDTYLKGEEPAKTFLKTADITAITNGRAMYSQK
jgi:predicted dienelactone hydrolase